MSASCRLQLAHALCEALAWSPASTPPPLLASAATTLPLLHAMKVGNEADRLFVADTLRNKDGSAFADIMSIVKRTGAIEATREAALEHQSQAFNTLDVLGQNEATVALSEMASRAVDRRG